MKKTFILLFLLATGAGITRAQETSRCAYAGSVATIFQKTDSMALLFRQMQQSKTGNWQDFIESAKADKGLGSFERFGDEKETLAGVYNHLHEGIVKELRILVKQIDPDDRLSDEQFLSTVKNAFDCYNSDKNAIHLKEKAVLAGRLAPDDIGNQLGPCEIILRGCISDAQTVRLNSLNACGVTGTGFLLALKKLLSSWIGGGAALFCYISASVVYNGSIDNCFSNYVDCLGH